jgi:hypothetical protein
MSQHILQEWETLIMELNSKVDENLDTLGIATISYNDIVKILKKNRFWDIKDCFNENINYNMQVIIPILDASRVKHDLKWNESVNNSTPLEAVGIRDRNQLYGSLLSPVGIQY